MQIYRQWLAHLNIIKPPAETEPAALNFRIYSEIALSFFSSARTLTGVTDLSPKTERNIPLGVEQVYFCVLLMSFIPCLWIIVAFLMRAGQSRLGRHPGAGCEFFLLSQVRFSRRRRCRTQKCGQLDLSSTRACWLVIYHVWLSRVARRQMRAVRVMRLGMRTYRISCMDVTDSICRRAAILSPHIANFR